MVTGFNRTGILSGLNDEEIQRKASKLKFKYTETERIFNGFIEKKFKLYDYFNDQYSLKGNSKLTADNGEKVGIYANLSDIENTKAEVMIYIKDYLGNDEYYQRLISQIDCWAKRKTSALVKNLETITGINAIYDYNGISLNLTNPAIKLEGSNPEELIRRIEEAASKLVKSGYKPESYIIQT